MSKLLILEEISLVGHDEESSRRIPFKQGVNVIIGPTGTGKSSLVELIKYTLGGAGKLTDAVRRGLVKSVLRLSVDGVGFYASRHINGKSVEIRKVKGNLPIGEYTIRPKEGAPLISDFLLEILGIPLVKIPRSRTKPGKDSARLTFPDIFRYLYLPQREIDRSVVRHLDSNLDPKRRAAFQLLYGLMNETVSRMEVELGKERDDLKEKRREFRDIEAYLKRVGPLEGNLMLEREAVRGELSELILEVEKIRQGLIASTDSEKHPRRELQRLYTHLRDCTRQSVEARARLENKKSLVSQLELDLNKLRKTKTSDDELVGIDFRVCPGCLQGLAPNRGADGKCSVCLQQLPEGDIEISVEQEIVRLERQLDETLKLLESERRASQTLSKKADTIKAEIRQIESELEERLEKYVSPKMEVVKNLTSRVAERKARILAIEETLKYWQECSVMRDGIAEKKGIVERLKQEIKMERYRLDEARERITELSEMFCSVMEYYHQPWYKSGRIDRDNYLPVVNGLPFEDLTAGSGGLPTLVNGAYHLAGLIFSILRKESLIPRFLIIDSPRKNLGAKRDDKNANAQVYRHYRMLSGTYGDNFQLIVVDNEVPSGFADFVELTLSYDAPLIPGVEHPGEGKVETIGDDAEEGSSQLSLPG